MNKPTSSEYLNAFVDGELAAGERDEALARLEADADFKNRVCELRTLKEMVRGAYAELPSVRQSRTLSCPPTWRYAMVAGLFLALGLGGGWFARDLAPAPIQAIHLAGLPAGYQPISLATRVDPDKVVLHLDSGDPAHVDAALDVATRLLRKGGDRVRVEVLVNNTGLDVLRQGTTTYLKRIQQLADGHANVSFVACGQTIAKLRQQGVKVKLVPEASVAPTAIGEVLRRMRQGWVYVKI